MFNDNDIVCDCNQVKVRHVKKYLEENDISDKDIDDVLEELDIGFSCDACLEENCDFIDVHYSKLIKN